jgi:hypothetical protein
MKKITDQMILDYAEENNFDIYDEADLTQKYDDMLDEAYGMIEVGALSWDTHRVLREMDPTAYRCGEVDYIDALEWDKLIDINGNIKYMEKVDIDNIRDILEGIESE